MLRDYVNRWDLIAKYPEKREKILEIENDIVGDQKIWYRFRPYNTQYDSDIITVYKFFHAKTAAMPEGRQFEFLF